MTTPRQVISHILKRLNKRAERAIHTPVTIRDLVAYQINDYSNETNSIPHGEFHCRRISSEKKLPFKEAVFETDAALITRMINYIEELANIAANIHIDANFFFPHRYAQHKDLDPMMNPEKENDITRLVLNEFGLYPNEVRGPFTEQSFHQLLTAILASAARYPANLQLILGTVPVLIKASIDKEEATDEKEEAKEEKEQEVLQNIAIIVDCGKTPRLQLVAKSCTADMDPSFCGKRLPNAINIPRFYKNKKTVTFPLLTSATPGASTSVQIAFGGSLICQTAGGAMYRLACDICFDHTNKIAKRSTKQHIRQTQQKGESILPRLATHVVLSNITKMQHTSFIGNTCTQSDPHHSYQKKSVTNEDNETFEIERTIDLPDPAFGSHTLIDVYPARELSPHLAKFDKLINAHNKFVLPLEAMRIYRRQEASIAHIDAVDKIIISHILKTIKNNKSRRRLQLTLALLTLEKQNSDALKAEMNSQNRYNMFTRPATEERQQTADTLEIKKQQPQVGS